MLLASTESSPVEPVSFTRSLPARSTKHSVPCLLGQALGWGTSIGGVMLWPPLTPSLWLTAVSQPLRLGSGSLLLTTPMHSWGGGCGPPNLWLSAPPRRALVSSPPSPPPCAQHRTRAYSTAADVDGQKSVAAARVPVEGMCRGPSSLGSCQGRIENCRGA